MSHSSRHSKPHDPQSSITDPKQSAAAAGARDHEPAVEHIRVRAYEISRARNGGPGDARTDWTQAEQELTAGRDAKR